MAKFHDVIGYTNSVETAPGVWTDQITEREYFGEVIKESRNWTSSDQANANLVVSNRISIIADDYANQNFSAMRYVKWYGVYWKVASIDIQRPRIILTLGGVYNGPTA